MTWSERPPVGAGVVACATTDGVGSPPSHKREVPWLALGLVGITIAVAGTTAWWTLARSNSKPIPPATGMTTSTPTAGIAAPTVATPANVRTEATPAAPVARVPEQVPVNAAELVPTPAASRSTATTPPATGLAVQDVERNAAERRARAQADREKGELAAHARALAEQQRQEIERARVERSAARRQADEQRVRAQQGPAMARLWI